MIFNRDCIHLFEEYTIKLSDSVLIKLEDAYKQKKELLITVDASHYGFRNGNSTVYRHDTVRDDIPTFVMPPKPIIEKHRPKESDRFGTVIAADYKETKFYKELSKKVKLEDLTTEEYLTMVKNHIMPLQLKDKSFNGLGYVQVVGRLHHEDGIRKVLQKEYLTVSIGAIPKRLVCSECGTDQMDNICNHYGNKSNRTFMLAESLEYEELSFVQKPADPFGKIIRIHDGLAEEIKVDRETSVLDASVDVMMLQDFFNSTDKTIVCMDNICTIINQEDSVMAKKQEAKITLSLNDEFGAEKIDALRPNLQGVNGQLALADDLTDRQFALVQKTSEGLKRRFPLCDELNVRIGLTLLDSAADLTEAEKDKVVASLEKAAKKLGIDLQDFQKDESQEGAAEDNAAGTDEGATDGEGEGKLQDEDAANLEDQNSNDEGASNDDAAASEPKTATQLIDELETALKAYEYPDVETLTDEDSEKENPITRIFSVLKSLAVDFKFAGAMLEGSINSYLMEKGQEAITKGNYDALTDEVTELKDQVKELEDDIALLDGQNRDLNYQLRTSLVDEIIASREALGLLEDSVEDERGKFSKFNYDALVAQVNDYRKMKIRMKDSTVNNKLEITKVSDPTLADSEEHGSSVDNLQDGQPSEGEQKELSFKEKVAIVKTLFRNI